MYLVSLFYQQHNDLDGMRSAAWSPAHRSTATSLAVIIHMMYCTVSGMLIYGVIKSRPSYLMPFFGIQLCDFFFSLPTFLASLYTSPHNHWEYQSHNSNELLDMRRLWPNANPATLYTSSLLIATCFILCKGFFLCVVWKCYRYLKMKEMILPLHFPYHSSGPEVISKILLSRA